MGGKGLSDAARAPYENKAKEQKRVYDAYIASEEGAAALRAFKDAKQATKEQFKPQSTEDGADGSEKKRKVEEAGEAEGKDGTCMNEYAALSGSSSHCLGDGTMHS